MIRKLSIVACFLIGLGLPSTHAQAPVADFSATPPAGCGPLGVNFKDLSTNGPIAWSWDFGDGSTSSQQSPSHSYSTPGSYTVTLISRNSSGSDAMRKTDYITVYPFPLAGFSSNLSIACAPAGIQFTDASSTNGGPAITSWTWSFGDGQSSTQQNPTNTYAQPGYYTVALTVTNSNGCSNTSNQPRYLRVVDGIQPNFVFDQSSTSCSAPFNGVLLNQSAGPGTLSYNWTMPGVSPASSTNPSPVVSFPATGTYNITLLVNSSLGCSATYQEPVTLTGNNALLKGPTTVCVNTPASYSDGSTPTPNSIAWNFGDGTTANTASPSKTWPAVGSYAVSMINTYSTCADTATATVQVVNPPTPAFTASPTGACKPSLTVNFTDGTSPAPTTWLWDFGDGTTSTVQNPSHTYASLGSYAVKLTVTLLGGCSNTLTKTNFINIQAPTASIGGTLSACVTPTGDRYAIYPAPNVVAPDGVATYSWTATGSNEGSSTAAYPFFTYPSPGTYPISLSITTNGGCTASASGSVQIGTSIPADFTISPALVCGSGTVTFTATSVGTGYQYVWLFGDGTASGYITSPTTTHSYTTINPVPFVTSLTLVNNGCQTTLSKNLTVNPPLPNFGSKITCPAAIGDPTTVNFTDSSAPDPNIPISYTWDYGDGSPLVVATSAPFAPPHTYMLPGTYNVTLTINDGTACSPAPITKPVVIPAISTAVSVNPNNCAYSPFTVTSTGNAPGIIANYAWTVGPKTGTGQSFTTQFGPSGTYAVNLTLTDIYGCPYVAPTTLINITGPAANFAIPAPGGGCVSGLLTFTDASTSYPGNSNPPNPGPNAPPNPINSWHWNFGDGTPLQNLVVPTTTHTFTDTGTFMVKLTVTDSKNCSNSITLPIQITSPTANFFPPDSFYCPGVPLTFIDSSKGYNLIDTWNFNDGSGATTNPHTFPNTNNVYNVTLTVKDKFNCSNSITKPVTIQKPIAAFNIYDTTGICVPLETIFAAHAQYYDSLYWEFGDGSSSTLDSTAHFYNTLDTFTAKLFVQGPGGCLDSASRRVFALQAKATTIFTYSPVKGCDSVGTQFNIIPSGFTTFKLYPGDGSVDSSQNNTPFHLYRSPGTYSPIIYLTDVSGCIVGFGSSSGPVTVLGATPFFSIDKHAFCDSSIVNFTDYTISNDGLSTETYLFGDGTPPQIQSPGTGTFDITHDFNQTGTWPISLKVTTTDNCTETYSDTVRVYQTPHPLIATTGLLCAGLIQFDGSITAPAVDTIIWNWNFGGGQSSPLQNPAVNLGPNTYAVTLTTSVSFGCTADTTANVIILAPPVIKGPKEITTPLGIPVTIPFTYGSDVISYSWTPADNLSCTTCANPVATLINGAQYQVLVTDSAGCTSSDSILIKTICNGQNYFLPNTFSPNGDGVNDYFYPRGTSLFNVQSLTVFNRWGQMVFQRRNFAPNAETMGWDGNFNGHPAPADAYVYIVEVICDNSQVVALHGSVTLVR